MPMQKGNIPGEVLPEGVYAEVDAVWLGDINAIPYQDTPVITVSKKELQEFGHSDKERIFFHLKYDFSKLGYAANIAVAVAFDKQSPLCFTTNITGRQGVGEVILWSEYLPDADNRKPVGEHTVEIMVHLRPRWTYWSWTNNYLDFSGFPSVATSVKSFKVIIQD